MSQGFDVFISFKSLDDRQQPTRDAALAREVFDFLNGRGFAVFLSSVTLERQGTSAYKNAIDEALDAAQVLIAVGTSHANLDSKWVRYEWDSFFTDMLSGVKPKGRLFVYVDGVAPMELPRSLRQSQVIAHGPQSLEVLYNFVTNALGRDFVAPVAVAEPGAPADAEHPRHWRARAKDYVREGNQIEAIKLVREITGLGLLESKKVVDSWHIGGSTGISVPSVLEEALRMSDWDVRAKKLALVGSTDQAVDLVRAATGLGLKHARHLVASL